MSLEGPGAMWASWVGSSSGTGLQVKGQNSAESKEGVPGPD